MHFKGLLIHAVMCATCAVALAGCPSCDEDPAEDPQDMASSPRPDGARDLPEQLDLSDASDAEFIDAGDAADMSEPSPACHADDTLIDEPETYAVGAWQVEVMTRSGAWRVSGPGGEFASGASPCEGRMRVGAGEPRVQMLFGAWKIGFDTRRMIWREVASSIPRILASGDTLTLSWPLTGEGGHDVSLMFSPHGEQDLSIEVANDWPEAAASSFSQRCEPDEAFFGLGTQVTGMDLRTGTYPLWTQEQGIHKPEEGAFFPLQHDPEAAYAPMGVLHSSRGWSAVLKPDTYTELDLCEHRSDTLTTTTYRAAPGWVFVAGRTPRERMTSISEYIGRITAPARWVFGPWNDTVGGPERVARVASILREQHIPSSAIWSEDWIGGELTANGYRLSYAWEWDEGTYPDLPQDIARLHEQGFAFLGYFNTFVVSTTRMWQEGIDNDYLIKDEEGRVYEMTDPAFRDASMVDLTNPGAREWLAGYLRRAAQELGMDGWMADFTEWLPHDAVLSNGERGWEMHNAFPLLWQQLNRDVLTEVHASEPDPSNWVYWVRSGWASTQGGTGGITPTMWGGDQNTDWGYDDGLPSVIPLGAHVGMSGVPIFGSDISGYSWIGEGDILSTKELFFRWSALGAFHPLMRTHQGAAKCLNWSFDRDPDTIAHYRRYASLHTLLLPYFEMLLEDATARGWPITRHPYLVFPEESALWEDDHYIHFLGDRLLVAPIIEEGATSRPLSVPAGERWWALLGGQSGHDLFAGGEAPGTVTEIPVYVRGGTVLPLLGQVVDSFYGATQEGMTDLAEVEGHYRVALYPDEAGELDETTFGAESVRVRGEGFGSPGEALVWSLASWKGEVLPACEQDSSLNCHAADHVRLVIQGGGELRVGAATLQVSGGGAGVRVDVYEGADAFGPWRAATPLEQGLDSMAPPVCENRKE